MLRFLFITSFVLCLGPDVYAQLRGQAKADSLLKELPQAKEDTNKVKLLNELSSSNVDLYNNDTALYYAHRALALAEKLDFKKGVAEATRLMGDVYFQQGNYPEALKYFAGALKIFQAIGDKEEIARCYRGLGSTYTSWGKYPEALKYFFAALKIDEAAGTKKGTARDHNNIGAVYAYQGKYPEALKYFSAALKIHEAGGNTLDLADAYNNVGIIQYKYGKYPEALINLYAARKIFDSIGSKLDIVNIQLNIGDTKLKQEKFEDALEVFFEALKIAEILKSDAMLGSVYCNIANVYNAMGKRQEAKRWLARAMPLLKKTGNVERIKASYQILYWADSALGDFKGAFESYKLHIMYRDSLYNETASQQSMQTKLEYEFDKKEAVAKAEQDKKNSLAKAKLQKQQTYTYMGIGAAVLLLGFSLFIFRGSKKLAHEKKRSEELLLNILPSEIADELKDRGAATAKHYDEVTVLFTDFVNFTGAGEKMGTQKLVEELHTCFKAFDDIISKHNIEKIKTIGDAYLAVSGLPVPDSQHADNVMSAAMEIRSFMLQRKKEGNDTFEIRIGIHSGPVVAGIVGVKKFAYDIWGDTVNTAARMEQKSEAGKINISQTTYDLVKGKYACTYRGEIDAKNKGVLKMYFVNEMI